MFSILNINEGEWVMNLRSLGELVRSRRIELGLSQAQLANLCSLSRTTVNLLENGTLSDLGVVKTMQLMDMLGLQLQASNPHAPGQRNALRMASISVSVSYKEKMSTLELAKALATGIIPTKRLPHIATLIDELPLTLLVAAVEEAAHLNSIRAKKIWSHVFQWASQLQSPRPLWH
jgi:transcriptional regulator with XRE-family HTH domain